MLVAIYNATDGANWKENDNWLSDAPISSWRGVNTDIRGRVVEIILDDMGLAGDLPQKIGLLDRLRHLGLARNKLTGTIPRELANLARLQSLHLQENEFTGEIPEALGELSNLEVLDLSSNNLKGAIPRKLANLANMHELILYHNRLSGEVPMELGQLTRLQNLRLDFNRLSGQIPSELSNLSRLENFEILENQLSGEIPPELGNIPRLRLLFVSRNAGLSGCIPDRLFEIETTDLVHVELEPCDQLEREVLVSWFEETGGGTWINSDGWLTEAPLGEWYGVTTNEFGRVVAIDLEDNNLIGEIPNALGRLSKLSGVHLSGNAITGCVPISLLNLPTNDFGDLMLDQCGVHFPDYWLKTAMLQRLGKEEGAEVSIAEMAALESLDLSWAFIRDLEGLQYATNLTSLTLGVSQSTPKPDDDSYPNRIENLAPLAQLTNLSELNLARCGLSDITAVSTLTNLEHLDIGFNRLNDIGPIAHLNNLESLLVSSNHVDDIAALSDIRHLIRLDVSDNKFSDIAPLAGLDRLQELDISYNDVVDLAPVSSLEQLERLQMKGIGVEDLSPIEDLEQLTHLDASWIDVEDLSPLSGLEALRTLMIGPAPISDVSTLSDLADLRELRIVGTELTDVSPLRDMRNLWSLVLSDNRISDLSPLSGLVELEVLDLNFNEIEDISPLVELSRLKDLRLNGNLVNDIETLVENLGLGESDRVELDDEVRNDSSNRTKARRLADRGVTVEFGTLYSTAFGQPQIHNDNLYVLPMSGDSLSVNLRLEDYANDFYEQFRDEFDFLMIITNIELGDDIVRGYSGAYLGVSNDVGGIGKDTFHNDGWGSPARLQGVLHFPWHEGLGGGPVLHELMHRWGNSIVEGLGSHWGWSSVHGHLGGFDIDELVDLGGGRYNAGWFGPGGRAGDGDPYSTLELYLAGLAPAEEVPDWIAGVDAGFSYTSEGRVEEFEDRGHVFEVKEFKTYSIDDVLAMHGPRVPDYSNSQKEFRAAAILLVDEDHPAMTEVVDEISRQVSRFSHPGGDDEWLYSFYEATRGRGTMLMGDLSQFLKEVEEE